jgi:hypothetical protein
MAEGRRESRRSDDRDVSHHHGERRRTAPRCPDAVTKDLPVALAGASMAETFPPFPKPDILDLRLV